MNFASNLLFFFSALGAFNGLIAGIYFISARSKRNLSTFMLGALLIVLSIRIGKSVAYFFDYSLSRNILQFGLTACLFIGPFLYFYVKTEMKQIRSLPASWLRQIICWSIAITVVGIIYPYQNYPQAWGNYIIPLIYLQWGAYIVFTAGLIRPLIRKIVIKEKLKPYEKWVLTICVAITLIFFTYSWSLTGLTKGSYIFAPLYFSLMTYLVIFILLYRKKANDLSSFAGQKYGNKKLDEQEVRSVIENLQQLMTAKELFRNPGLKLSDLSREINVPEHYLSRILNDSLQKNFTLFVNEYRIEAACQMLAEPGNLTIEGIGDEVGFNSKSTFFAAFKKIKGLTPNTYMRQVTPDL